MGSTARYGQPTNGRLYRAFWQPTNGRLYRAFWQPTNGRLYRRLASIQSTVAWICSSVSAGLPPLGGMMPPSGPV